MTCPRCHKSDKIVQIKRQNTLTCENCNYVFTDNETSEAYGMKRIIDGETVSFELTNESWHKFWCWYCLKGFDADKYKEYAEHVETRHKTGDPMQGCVTRGFINAK